MKRIFNNSISKLGKQFNALESKKSELEAELDRISEELDNVEKVNDAVCEIADVLDEFEGSLPTNDFDITIQGQNVDLITLEYDENGKPEHLHFYSGVDDVHSDEFDFEDEPIPTDEELVEVARILNEYF